MTAFQTAAIRLSPSPPCNVKPGTLTSRALTPAARPGRVSMMKTALYHWHDYMHAPTAESLAVLLDDDVVFESPVVQVGRAPTRMHS